MIFRETRLPGAYLIEIEPRTDDRGFFARTWCRNEFTEHGLETEFVQGSLSRTGVRGTIRGMHFQKAPHEEVKLVSCIRGAIYDVIVDLRPESPTYLQWLPVEMTGGSHQVIYIPKQFAHGFQTLADDTEVSYMVSAFYVPEAATGLRYDDPAIGIDWPMPVAGMSERDQTWPLLEQSPVAGKRRGH